MKPPQTTVSHGSFHIIIISYPKENCQVFFLIFYMVAYIIICKNLRFKTPHTKKPQARLAEIFVNLHYNAYTRFTAVKKRRRTPALFIIQLN